MRVEKTCIHEDIWDVTCSVTAVIDAAARIIPDA